MNQECAVLAGLAFEWLVISVAFFIVCSAGDGALDQRFCETV